MTKILIRSNRTRIWWEESRCTIKRKLRDDLLCALRVIFGNNLFLYAWIIDFYVAHTQNAYLCRISIRNDKRTINHICVCGNNFVSHFYACACVWGKLNITHSATYAAVHKHAHFATLTHTHTPPKTQLILDHHQTSTSRRRRFIIYKKKT